MEDLNLHCDLDLEERFQNVLPNNLDHDDALLFISSLVAKRSGVQKIWDKLSKGLNSYSDLDLENSSQKYLRDSSQICSCDIPVHVGVPSYMLKRVHLFRRYGTFYLVFFFFWGGRG